MQHANTNLNNEYECGGPAWPTDNRGTQYGGVSCELPERKDPRRAPPKHTETNQVSK